MIKSHLLYQLSYAPGTRLRKASARGRRLAKRPPDVQQTGRVFPGHRQGRKMRKSRRNPAAFPKSAVDCRLPRSEPPGAAHAAVIPARPVIAISVVSVVAVAAVHHAVLKAMVPPAAAEPAFHMRQDGKATLLALSLIHI